MLTLVYKGLVTDFYTMAYFPLSVIAFVGVYKSVSKWVFIPLALIVFYYSIYSAIVSINMWNNLTGKDLSISNSLDSYSQYL